MAPFTGCVPNKTRYPRRTPAAWPVPRAWPSQNSTPRTNRRDRDQASPMTRPPRVSPPIDRCKHRWTATTTTTTTADAQGTSLHCAATPGDPSSRALPGGWFPPGRGPSWTCTRNGHCHRALASRAASAWEWPGTRGARLPGSGVCERRRTAPDPGCCPPYAPRTLCPRITMPPQRYPSLFTPATTECASFSLSENRRRLQVTQGACWPACLEFAALWSKCAVRRPRGIPRT